MNVTEPSLDDSVVRFNLKDHKDQGPEEPTTYEPVSVKVSCSAWKWF